MKMEDVNWSFENFPHQFLEVLNKIESVHARLTAATNFGKHFFLRSEYVICCWQLLPFPAHEFIRTAAHCSSSHYGKNSTEVWSRCMPACVTRRISWQQWRHCESLLMLLNACQIHQTLTAAYSPFTRIVPTIRASVTGSGVFRNVSTGGQP